MAQPIRVLIVEDSDDLVVLMPLLFGREAKVTTFSEHFEAIPISAWRDADVALIDFMLPVVNGCDLAAQARAANPELRIVIWTALDHVPCADTVTVLRKSAGIEALMATIRG